MIKEHLSFETDDWQLFKTIQEAKAHNSDIALAKLIAISFKSVRSSEKCFPFFDGKP